jgi:ABC-type transport system substrate-binding protein
MSMALDRDSIYEALYDLKRLTSAGIKIDVRQHNLVSAGMPQYWLDPAKADPAVRPFLKYDPDGAKKLLADAGFANGFTANYHYPAAAAFGPSYAQEAELIQEMLGKVGIKLTAVVENGADYGTKTFLGQYDGIAYIIFGAAYPEHQLELRYLPGPQNTSHVDDPDITAKVNAILAELNLDKRIQMIRDIQNPLADKMYYVPLVNSAGPAWYAAQSYVKNAGTYMTARLFQTTIEDTYLWLDK